MSRLVIWPRMMLSGWTETKLWTLKYGSKSIQTSNFETASPKTKNNLFISFVTTVKKKKLRGKSLCLPILKSITEIITILRVCMILGVAVSKLETFVWILNHTYFRVHNLVSFHPKSITLGQMTNLTMIFHVVVSVNRFVKIWNGQYKSMQLIHYIAKFVFEVSFWRFESSFPIDFPDLNITDGDSLTII